MRALWLTTLLLGGCTLSGRFEDKFPKLYCEAIAACPDAITETECLSNFDDFETSNCDFDREAARDCLNALKKTKGECGVPSSCDEAVTYCDSGG